jgi:hypothetical protein
MSFSRPLVCALSCGGCGAHSRVSVQGKQHPEVAGHDREAWRRSARSIDLYQVADNRRVIARAFL